VQVSSTTFLPVLTVDDDRHGDPAAPVLDEFAGELAVAYSFGPPWGERLVTWLDLDRLGLSRRVLRETAAGNLRRLLDEGGNEVDVHGGAPALTLSFAGPESSLLLAVPFCDRLAGLVPGDLVAAVPARDVVVVTGSLSPSGLDAARETIERVFGAGAAGTAAAAGTAGTAAAAGTAGNAADGHLLTRDLLIRRNGAWAVYAERRPRPRPVP